MNLTNIKMMQCLDTLQQIAHKTYGKLGYAIARNIRKISDELIEFEEIRLNYITTHGKQDKDGNYILHKGTKEYDNFIKEISILAEIEHNVDIYKVDAELIFESSLTAQEIIDLDFMINHEGEE